MAAITLRQIETLRAIAAAGGLVGAARALSMTPAALTMRLKNLEESVGIALFERTPAGLRLNSAGTVALEASGAIDRALREFVATMEAVRTGSGGMLSLGAVTTAKYFAPRLAAAFLREHPGLDLRLRFGNRAEIASMLRDADVDVVFSGRPPADVPVTKARLGPHPYVMIAAPDHRLAGRRRVPRRELEGESFLVREPGSGSRSLFDYFIGDTPFRLARIGIDLGSNESIKQAAMAGLGIALISGHTVAAEVADGRLARLDVEGLPIVRQWFMLRRADRDPSPTAKTFQAFAATHAGTFLPRLPPIPAASRKPGDADQPPSGKARRRRSLGLSP
ncbi:MAG: LysR family transcriptional regulator [Hyphomicrobiales bacterium]|nr:LysR family transcriptional regulator [Hyphomicrobiales bacterium]